MKAATSKKKQLQVAAVWFFFYAAETLFKCSTKHNLELENSPHGAGAHQHKWIEVSQKKSINGLKSANQCKALGAIKWTQAQLLSQQPAVAETVAHADLAICTGTAGL